MESNSRTTGWQLKTQHRYLAEAVELCSSMRFAISLLSLLAIASVIGTVVRQNEPLPNYVNQFGSFWFEIFDKAGLLGVYSSSWFLLILAFLMLSTLLCIARNTPKIIKEIRSWREQVREQSLRNFHHQAEWHVALPAQRIAEQLVLRLKSQGYRVKQVAKSPAILVSAKKGMANKVGYIFAHAAIVVICIGGLVDSDLPIRLQQWFFNKQPFTGSGLIADIPAQHRLSVNNPVFRGNMLVAEGARSSTAIISRPQGVLLQPLPFTLELQKFIVDFYSTGMPKLFASQVVVTDHETGKRFAATIKVNQPLIYNGVAVYQSSFEDGGSKLQLTGYLLKNNDNTSFPLTGEVGGSSKMADVEEYVVEWSGLRVFNVENTASQDARAVNVGQTFQQNFAENLNRHSGSAAKPDKNLVLKNVGPSVQYKLRDKTGQAREYHNYMQPVRVDGVDMFLAGMRETPSEPFRYAQIPADEQDSVTEWMRFRAALANEDLQKAAARRYVQQAFSASLSMVMDEKQRTKLEQSVLKSLTIFAGNGVQGGYVALAKFLERLPATEQKKTADVLMKILNSSAWEIWQLAREKEGLPPMVANEKSLRFLQNALNAYADMLFYRALVYLQLRGFQQVQASVFQISRSPGKVIVYLGCIFLVLGVFSMLYIRERRVWLWITSLKNTEDTENTQQKSDQKPGSSVLMAMSTQRKTRDFEEEFSILKAYLASE